MQAIFRMGVPVTGKNVFPSNIQGLPTWYEIRVNRQRLHGPHAALRSDGRDESRDLSEGRGGDPVRRVAGLRLHVAARPAAEPARHHDLGLPLAEMCNAQFDGVRERILMKNIAYAGALAALLDMDTGIIRALLKEKFSKKPALMDSNQKAVAIGYDYAKTHFDCPLPIRLEPMEQTKDSILIDGNTAAALGCLYAGATVGAWYPITPATSLMEAFKGFCQKYRREPETNRNRFAILQAEDELAAIGMVIGASWAGARAFTPTAGPGISLMTEFIGLAYYAEVPAVIFDVQRTGPSTGMPTRTQQGDLMLCAYASHGDTRHICLYPSDPREAFELAVRSFDLAERFQTPVFVLSDLDIGMNDWMIPKLTWDDGYRPDRGKVLTARAAGSGEDVPPLHRRRRRWRDPSNAARHASERRVFHARLGPQPVRRVYGGRRRVRRGPRSDRSKDAARGALAAGAVPSHVPGREARVGDGRRVPRGVHGSDGPPGEGRHRDRLPAGSRASRSATRCARFSPRTRSTSSSSRIATRSCGAC